MSFPEIEFKDVIDNLQIGVCRIEAGHKGRFVYINSAFLEMFGYRATELPKISMSELFDNLKDYQAFERNVLREGVVKNQEIIGMTVAKKCKITGKVRIINTSKDLTKIKKNEVLVAEMTSPEYIYAMRQASAVITDEGGLTCHAAIVTRELDIPCIVGTKIASKVLHDGDLVEVDANKGVVRILDE